MPDQKLDALRTFTRSLVANRGKASQAELNAFFEAGYTEVKAMEVILGLAVKVMSNYTNSIAGTPLDREVERLRWEKPKIAMRAA